MSSERRPSFCEAFHGQRRILDVTVLIGAIPPSRWLLRSKSGGSSPASRTRRLSRQRGFFCRPQSHRIPGRHRSGRPRTRGTLRGGGGEVKVGRLLVPVATATHLVVMKVLAAGPKTLKTQPHCWQCKADQIDAKEMTGLVGSLASALAENDILMRLAEARSELHGYAGGAESKLRGFSSPHDDAVSMLESPPP